MLEELHELLGNGALFSLIGASAVGALLLFRVKTPIRPFKLLALHKLFGFLFVALAFAHAASAPAAEPLFVSGALLVGSALVLSALFSLLPSLRFKLLVLKLVLLAAGLGVLYTAHQSFEDREEGVLFQPFESEEEEEYEDD